MLALVKMENAKKWYAVYTKPRWEKKVHLLLSKWNIESYCPLNKVHRKWSDRTKLVEEPLFKSYVFVRIRPEQEAKIRMANGVLNFVYWLGKPAVVKQSEINCIRRFLNEYENVIAEPIHIKPSQRVVITAGVLMNSEGNVLKVTKKKIQVVLDSIGFRLITYIDKERVRVIQST
jgi:transcription antitermination factor NusG